MSLRARLVVLGLVAVAVVAAAGLVVVDGRRDLDNEAMSSSTAGSLAELQRSSYLVFRSTARGNGYGRLAAVPVADPTGARVLLSRSCDRVYARRGTVLCLSARQGVTTTYAAQVFDRSVTAAPSSLPLTGVPSRARLSPDGSRAATTTFVSGDSYAAAGFSTRTTVSTLATGASVDLEDFAVVEGGRRSTPPDRNVWGVTFAADDRTFYATVGAGGTTRLVQGDLVARTLTTVRVDAECPSLSPDGSEVVFKQRGDLPAGQWRLVGLDLASGRTTLLAETRSVDDQVEWLDDHTVAYGLPRPGADAAVSDVWQVPADGSGAATVLVPEAWSPALVGAG